jgi:hypothetical protein
LMTIAIRLARTGQRRRQLTRLPFRTGEPKFEPTVQSAAGLCGWSLSTTKRRIRAAETRVSRTLNAAPQHARSQP